MSRGMSQDTRKRADSGVESDMIVETSSTKAASTRGTKRETKSKKHLNDIAKSKPFVKIYSQNRKQAQYTPKEDI
jgi:hypothetical protein